MILFIDSVVLNDSSLLRDQNTPYENVIASLFFLHELKININFNFLTHQLGPIFPFKRTFPKERK